MMTPAQEVLALKFLSCGRWEYDPEVLKYLDQWGRDSRGIMWVLGPNADGEMAGEATWLPDLGDASTGGVLLEDLWKIDPGAWFERNPATGIVSVTSYFYQDQEWTSDLVQHGETLGEAVVRSLLALWMVPVGE